MRKFLLFSLFFCVLLLALGSVFVVSVVDASTPIKWHWYVTGNDDFTMDYDQYWDCQTFNQTFASHTVTSVRLLLKRIGNPSTVTVSIRGCVWSSYYTAWYPVGSDLVVGTTNGNTLSASDFEWRQITFNSEYTLGSFVFYAIVVRSAGSSPSNTVCWARDITAASYEQGEAGVSSDYGVNWIMNFPNYDCLFEVWGNDVPSSQVIPFVDVPNYVQLIVLFVLCGLPAVVLSMAGAKYGWGLQGLLFGLILGLGSGVCVGLVPFWFVFLLSLFAVMFLYSMAKRS